MRCRKAQMELCLALERRNSAYLLENSRSPSCLLRSGPAESSCLKPPKTHFWTPFTAHTFHFVKSIFRALYFIYSPEIKNPPESGLQKSVKRVQQWGVHVSDARQETSHLIFISEDIKKRTFYSKTDQETRTLMLTGWFTWQEVMKPNRRGSPAGLPGRTASCRRLRWRVSETRQADSVTQKNNIWICCAPVKAEWDSPAQILIPGQPASFCTPPVINPPSQLYDSDYLTCQHLERGVRYSSCSFLKSQSDYRVSLP